MRDAVPTGSKRKRVVSGAENTQSNGRSRSASRVKRRRALHGSSDEGEGSAMDVDEHARWDLHGSDSSEGDDVDSCEW